MSNETVKKVVNDYLQREDPGYALLIDAPWGAGKTHFIKRFINQETNDPLYVTLYDVQTAEAFEWALVRAMQPWTESKTGQWAGRLKELSRGIKLFGCSVDLDKMNLTELVLNNLPDTLIFDDIERCGLSQKQLSGLINRFVEHQKKRVILLANVEKIHKSDEVSDPDSDMQSFDVTREKLIGQTVSLSADLDGALAAFWRKVPDGQGLDTLKERQRLINEVFDDAGHHNLRLILRAVRDCARMLDDLTPDMLDFRDSVDRLIQTHLALHMAYHGGELTKDDLKARSNRELFQTPLENILEDKPEDTQIEAIRMRLSTVATRHKNANILDRYNSVFPGSVAWPLLVDGHVDKAYFQEELKRCHQFSPAMDRPFNAAFLHWMTAPYADLKAFLEKLDEKMAAGAPSSSEEIMTNYLRALTMARARGETNHQNLQKKYLDYIERIAAADDLEIVAPFDRPFEIINPLADLDVFRQFTADSLREHDDTKAIFNRLEKAREAFTSLSIESAAKGLLSQLKADPQAFLDKFDESKTEQSLSSVPVLHSINSDAFSDALLNHIQNRRDMAIQIGHLIFNRLRKNRSIYVSEVGWLEFVVDHLKKKAAEIDPVLEAQVGWFCGRFLQPPSAP